MVYLQCHKNMVFNILKLPKSIQLQFVEGWTLFGLDSMVWALVFELQWPFCELCFKIINPNPPEYTVIHWLGKPNDMQFHGEIVCLVLFLAIILAPGIQPTAQHLEHPLLLLVLLIGFSIAYFKNDNFLIRSHQKVI